MTASLRRHTIFRAAPATVGTAWAKALSVNLAHEGRSVEGGWPGTIVEARALVSRHLRQELEGRDMRQATSEELATAATATYDAARSTWVAMERRSRVVARQRA